MTRRKAISVLIALALIVLTIPTIEGATDEWVVSTVDEDLFYATYRFEGVDMAYLQGKDMQIRSWFWFEGPNVLRYGRYIVEAYLEVMTPSIGATDLNASMTLYGIPSQKGGTPSNAEDPSFINGPYTTHYYNVNLSSFVGPGVWHNITVTNIVREINQGYYFWDGHDVAFSTLSPSGGAEERSVATIEAGYPAKLYVHYGEGPDDPDDRPAVWIDNFQGLDIYQYEGDWVNYTDFTVVDSGQGALNIHNSSHLEIIGVNSNGDVYAISDNTDNAFTVKFAVNPTVLHDDNGATTEQWGFLYGISNNPGFIDDNVETAAILATGNNVFATWWQYWVYTVDAGDVLRYKTGQFYSRDEILNNWHYLKFTYNGSTNAFTLNVYSDLEMTDLLETITDDLAGDIGPTNYHYAFNPWDHASGAVNNDMSGWLWSDVVSENTFFVVDPETNETLIDNLPDLNSTIEWIEINYPDPEDPNPGDEWQDPDEGILTRLNFKLIIFVIGMVFFLGAPLYGFAERPEAATWILILFASIVGVALLWSLQTM